jgi:hypothetical protein
LIIDDSVEDKKYTDRNELICWHYDHSQERSVKGVNFLTALYYSQEVGMPASVEWIRKDQPVKLERLKVRNNQNHFAMRTQLMIAANKAAYANYLKLSTPVPVFN